MTCLYEGTIDDLIQAIVKIVNYKPWLTGGPTSKGHDSTSLNLKAIAKYGYPRPMEKAIQSYLGVEALKTKDCAKLCGFAKWKLNFPPGAKCDSHQANKVLHSSP